MAREAFNAAPSILSQRFLPISVRSLRQPTTAHRVSYRSVCVHGNRAPTSFHVMGRPPQKTRWSPLSINEEATGHTAPRIHFRWFRYNKEKGVTLSKISLTSLTIKRPPPTYSTTTTTTPPPPPVFPACCRITTMTGRSYLGRVVMITVHASMRSKCSPPPLFV